MVISHYNDYWDLSHVHLYFYGWRFEFSSFHWVFDDLLWRVFSSATTWSNHPQIKDKVSSKPLRSPESRDTLYRPAGSPGVEFPGKLKQKGLVDYLNQKWSLPQTNLSSCKLKKTWYYIIDPGLSLHKGHCFGILCRQCCCKSIRFLKSTSKRLPCCRQWVFRSLNKHGQIWRHVTFHVKIEGHFGRIRNHTNRNKHPEDLHHVSSSFHTCENFVLYTTEYSMFSECCGGNNSELICRKPPGALKRYSVYLFSRSSWVPLTSWDGTLNVKGPSFSGRPCILHRYFHGPQQKIYSSPHSREVIFLKATYEVRNVWDLEAGDL